MPSSRRQTTVTHSQAYPRRHRALAKDSGWLCALWR
jgi:hypothetical protein